ncbi:MAG: lanthionine synthetase LanC family protein [Planctomycetota bacterium]
MAAEAGEWLERRAIATPAGLAWPGDPAAPDPVAPDLYHGSAGVVLFLFDLGRATGEERWTALARAGADELLASLPASLSAPAEAGLFTGVAGIGLFLLWAGDALDRPAARELAAAAGRRLRELGEPTAGGISWPMDPAVPTRWPNFAHGTAGVAFFLAALFDATEELPFLAAARAAGGALLASGLPAARPPGYWNNAGLCCGTAGVGEFLLDLHEKTGRADALALARALGADLLARAAVDETGRRWPLAEHRVRPAEVAAQTGLMEGAAGIGRFLLRLDALERGRERPRPVPGFR